jgi:hypothetical protein
MENVATEEFISRTEALKDFESCNAENPNWTPQRVKTLLLRQPAADVAEVVHGQWEGEGDGYADGEIVLDCGIALNADTASMTARITRICCRNTAPAAARRWTELPNERAAVCARQCERRKTDAGLLLDLQEPGIQK